jgi:serine/threonine protein kinase
MSSAGDPTAAFFANLRSSGLLRQSQLQELWAWVATTQSDVPNLAKEITRRRWLTPFQIKEIFRGRGRELRIDRFVLEDLLGEGGMGRVYKAIDTRLGRTVALKLIRPERLQHAAAQARFDHEILALSKMKHPNVVDVFDAGKLGDTHYYVMEYVDGIDLTRMVRDTGPLPVLEACDYIRQAALGLHHAYEKGLVHRDIKPSNILVSRTNRLVKLVDLGLARLMENDQAVGGEQAGRITQEGFVIGTPDFLAPEQARNPMAVDIRADIYALGGTLYYLLTGKTPFEGANPTEKLLRHCTEPPPSLLQRRPDAPVALEQIIHWCMAKQPESRPQTPLQLAVALQPFCPVTPLGYPTTTSGRHPIPVAPPPVQVPPVPASAVTAVSAPEPPQPDPVRSSMVFKLPPQLTSTDPIRRRARPNFPWSTVLLGLGSVLVIAILGYAAYLAFLRPDEPPLESFTNSLGIKMVKLDGGTFRMGSSPSEPGYSAEEAPAHTVTLTAPFLISATEVSHGQYLKLMGSSPSRLAPKAYRGQYRPVDSITWDEANEFCQKLTQVEKDQNWSRRGWAYRLPTEAEWEFAARAGTETPFAFGNQLEFEKQGLFRPLDSDPLGVGGGTEVPLLTQEVGKSKANPFGLHDMHGNVAEWCLDWYRPSYPSEEAQLNPTGPSDGDKRVIRGGSFRTPATGARSAARSGVRPNERRDDVGFRIVYAPIQK